MSGAKIAPWWVVALDAAKDWGKAPWEIGGGSRLLWWFRYEARRDVMLKLEEMKKNG